LAKTWLILFDDVSPGSCFFLPHGTIVINRIMDFIRNKYSQYGYEEVITPIICEKRLWTVSGHYEKYKENMFVINSCSEDAEYSLCAMNCPKHIKIYQHLNPSYRHLPLRLADFGPLHRNEPSGTLRGLSRVRLFHQDDAHIFCTRDQIKSEIKSCLQLLDEIYKTFGLPYNLTLSTRPDQYIGDVELWDAAEVCLAECLQEFGSYQLKPKDGAFYGPKIDIMTPDVDDKYHQLGTIQLDFNLPQRFNLRYHVAADDNTNRYETPVIIHRSMLGSLERFLAILLERTNGYLPFCFSPRQIAIIPVNTERHSEYADQIRKLVCSVSRSIRVHILEDHSLSKRIREAETLHYNFIVVVGDAEIKSDTVSIRQKQTQTTMSQELFKAELTSLLGQYCQVGF